MLKLAQIRGDPLWYVTSDSADIEWTRIGVMLMARY